MICPECGSELDGTTIFCTECGSSLLKQTKYRIGPGDFVEFGAPVEVMDQELWDSIPNGTEWGSFVEKKVVNLLGEIAIVLDGRNVLAKVYPEEFDILPVLDDPQTGFVKVSKSGVGTVLVTVTTY